jgi:hypothetical protein
MTGLYAHVSGGGDTYWTKRDTHAPTFATSGDQDVVAPQALLVLLSRMAVDTALTDMVHARWLVGWPAPRHCS